MYPAAGETRTGETDCQAGVRTGLAIRFFFLRQGRSLFVYYPASRRWDRGTRLCLLTRQPSGSVWGAEQGTPILVNGGDR